MCTCSFLARNISQTRSEEERVQANEVHDKLLRTETRAVCERTLEACNAARLRTLRGILSPERMTIGGNSGDRDSRTAACRARIE